MIVEILATAPLPRLRFVIDGRPVPKGRPRFVHGMRHPITPLETRRYESHVRAMAMHALRISHLAWPMDAHYALRVHVAKVADRGDADNFLKLASDAIEHVFFGNDRRVRSSSVSQEVDKRHPRIEIDVEVIELATVPRKRTRTREEMST